MYGGNGGIKATVVMDIILNRGTEEIETIAGVDDNLQNVSTW